MNELNFISSAPKSNSEITNRSRSKTPEILRIAQSFGRDYFDGDRAYGYGGYKYDGRWQTVAAKMAKHYRLLPGSRILDIGCAKGFLVRDFLGLNKEYNPFGIDISEYAVLNCEKDVVGRIHIGSAVNLPFPDNSFDLVVSINTLHNLERNEVLKAVKEIERVSKGNSFIQVDSYLNDEQRNTFLKWVLTAKFHGYPAEWLEIFKEANYKGDYAWTIV